MKHIYVVDSFKKNTTLDILGSFGSYILHYELWPQGVTSAQLIVNWTQWTPFSPASVSIRGAFIHKLPPHTTVCVYALLSVGH